MNPAIVIAVLRFLVSGKEMKIAGGILLALFVLPALTVVVIAATPITIVQNLLNSFAPPTLNSLGVQRPKASDIVLQGSLFFPGDQYEPGNCTYWVYMRRSQVGQPIPNTWGNAATWAPRAATDGYHVDHTPTQYAIMQTPNSAGGLGHVAFVESVDSNGTWNISEMNVYGLYFVDRVPMPPAAAAAYNFIHFKE